MRTVVNSWREEQYKGINSRWREPDSDRLCEVQFHTRASVEAKQVTHGAYERKGQRDKAFGRDLKWGHTSMLYSYERGNRDNELYPVTAEEAMRIVDCIRREAAASR